MFELNKDDREYVKAQVAGMFSSFACNLSDAVGLADAVLDDVCKDIEETADPDLWHTGDIQIAVKRVLQHKLGVDG